MAIAAPKNSLPFHPEVQFVDQSGGAVFVTLTEHRLRRGTHRSVPALENAIREYLDLHNDEPKPFRWTKSADEIIASVSSVIKRINQTGH